MHVVQANIFTSEVWWIRRLPLRRVGKIWRSSGCPKIGWGRTLTGGTSFQSEWLYCFHRPHRRRCNFTHPLRLLCRHYVAVYQRKNSSHTHTDKILFTPPFITQFHLIHSRCNFGRLFTQKCEPRDNFVQFHWIKLLVQKVTVCLLVLWNSQWQS